MYLKRLIEQKIKNALSRMGGVNVIGPKGVGKTKTCMELCASYISLDDPKVDNVELADIRPYKILEGEKPRLIDEWQKVPKLFNAVRKDIDNKQLKGAYILTGSSTPSNEDELHSGAMRIARIKMRPLTYTESLISEKKVYFDDFFKDNFKVDVITTNFKFDDHIVNICKGGWPINYGISLQEAWENNNDYITNFIELDSQKNDKKPNQILFTKFLKSVSRNISHDVKKTTLAEDADINVKVVDEYLGVLSKYNLLDLLYVWNIKIRSKITLRKSPKINFIDPCLATNLIGATYEKLSSDFETLGFFFESMVIRDLKTYAINHGYEIYFYSDNDNLEIDCIIEKKSGEWSLFEIKLGSTKGIESAIDSINKFIKKIDEKVLKRLKTKNIIVAKSESYHKDGINIVAFSHIFDK